MSNKTLNINITKLALYGKVLGDETRLRILLELIDGEKNVKDLASFLGISDSAISHHLRELRLAKIVKTRRDGKQIYYSYKDNCTREQIIHFSTSVI